MWSSIDSVLIIFWIPWFSDWNFFMNSHSFLCWVLMFYLLLTSLDFCVFFELTDHWFLLGLYLFSYIFNFWEAHFELFVSSINTLSKIFAVWLVISSPSISPGSALRELGVLEAFYHLVFSCFYFFCLFVYFLCVCSYFALMPGSSGMSLHIVHAPQTILISAHRENQVTAPLCHLGCSSKVSDKIMSNMNWILTNTKNHSYSTNNQRKEILV